MDEKAKEQIKYLSGLIKEVMSEFPPEEEIEMRVYYRDGLNGGDWDWYENNHTSSLIIPYKDSDYTYLAFNCTLAS